MQRITLDLSAEERESADALAEILKAAEEESGFRRAAQWRMAGAMVALGKPIFRGVRKPAPKPTRHVRHMARMKARAAS